MRNVRRWMLAPLIVAAVIVGRLSMNNAPAHAAVAENRATAAIAADVDRIQGLIGNNQIDDAMANPNFLPNDAAAREATRGHLIELRNAQTRYLGYDIVAVQRLSDRLQIASVLAYYDVRPVLFKIHFYKPTGRTEDPWITLRFEIFEDVLEQLKELPTDYPGHALAVRY